MCLLEQLKKKLLLVLTQYGKTNQSSNIFNQCILHWKFIISLKTFDSLYRGIEWVNSYSILTWSYPNSSPNSSLVRNELRLTNILTGYVQPVRNDRGDESPVEIVRVSPYRYDMLGLTFKPKFVSEVCVNISKFVDKTILSIVALILLLSKRMLPLRFGI